MFVKLIVSLTALTSIALADELKVTSFVSTGQKNRAAELCGKVTSDTPKIHIVQINVDPRGNVGKYVVMTAQDGTFCTVVSTYTREATAELLDGKLNSKVEAKVSESK